MRVNDSKYIYSQLIVRYNTNKWHVRSPQTKLDRVVKANGFREGIVLEQER